MRLTPHEKPYAVHMLGPQSLARRLGELVTSTAKDRLEAEAVSVSLDVPLAQADPAEPTSYRVVVALISADEPLDAGDLERIAVALDAGVAVLPVLVNGTQATQLPPPLQRINTLRWPDQTERLVRWILQLLGLVEADRKVFLSYRQRDTAALADQLRHELQGRGFDVFLDRFSVDPGDDFQRRLDIELSDKAFVVLLESPSAAHSEWVRHEVAFALTHGISLIALTLPGTPRRRRLAAIPDDFRTVLNVDDLMPRRLLRDRRLVPAALERIGWQVEWEHARRLRRHREQLVDTLSEWLRSTGHDVSALPGWTLAATGGSQSGIYVVTPRAPTPRDLHRADLARRDVDPSSRAVVAHNAELLDDELRELNLWIGEGRNLSTAVHAGLRILRVAQ